MCGLVGIAGDLMFKDEATMKSLLVLDYFRGPDSTGLAAIRSNGDAKLVKLNSHPLDLFESGKFKEALNGNNSRAFIGHNRAATRGQVNSFNAHPYHIDHIIGAHNGTLDMSSVNRLEKALDEKFPTDSLALMAGIARLGVEEAIGMCSDDGDEHSGASAWSLTWFDQVKGTLNFLRNKKRPMWYAFTEDFKRLFWASEWPMIQHAVQRSGQYKLYSEPETNFRFRSTEENVWYEFELELLQKGSAERPKPKAKEVKGYEIKYVYTGNYSHTGAKSSSQDPFLRRQSNVIGFQIPEVNPPTKNGKTTGKTISATGTAASTVTKSTAGKVLHLESTPLRPLAGLMAEDEFLSITKNGCAWCKGPVEITDPGILVIERDDIVVCHECTQYGQTRVLVKHDLYL